MKPHETKSTRCFGEHRNGSQLSAINCPAVSSPYPCGFAAQITSESLKNLFGRVALRPVRQVLGCASPLALWRWACDDNGRHVALNRPTLREKAVEDYRTPRRFARTGAAGQSARSWTAPVLWRFGRGRAMTTGVTSFSTALRSGKAVEDYRTPRRFASIQPKTSF